MRRWVCVAALAAAVFLLPKGQGVDVGELEPVELLYIQKEGGLVHIQTDTGVLGRGNTLTTALQNAEKSAMGLIFLDTVDYVLVTERTKSVVPELQGILRPSVHLVLASGPVALKEMPKFLKTHKPKTTMKDWMTGKKDLSRLMTTGERYYLV